MTDVSLPVYSLLTGQDSLRKQQSSAWVSIATMDRQLEEAVQQAPVLAGRARLVASELGEIGDLLKGRPFGRLPKVHDLRAYLADYEVEEVNDVLAQCALRSQAATAAVNRSLVFNGRRNIYCIPAPRFEDIMLASGAASVGATIGAFIAELPIYGDRPVALAVAGLTQGSAALLATMHRTVRNPFDYVSAQLLDRADTLDGLTKLGPGTSSD